MQRIAIAEKYRELYEKQAKENKSLNGGDKKSELQNSATPIKPQDKINVREKLAKAANVSSEMYRQAKKILDSGDEELKKAVMSQEMSIRQRGIGNPNPVKLGRCIKELERIYGVRDGSAGQAEPKVSDGNITSQSDIADMIGISVDTLSRDDTRTIKCFIMTPRKQKLKTS